VVVALSRMVRKSFLRGFLLSTEVEDGRAVPPFLISRMIFPTMFSVSSKS
jgi:hypothetical protein